jgi:hypothetical protein
MRKPAKSRRLPLQDPRWWSFGEVMQHCREDPLFRQVDLVAAVEQELVGIKVEYLDLRTKPAKRVSQLLTARFFEREAAFIQFWGGFALRPRTAEWSNRRYSFFFWKPDIKKFWPDIRTQPASTDIAREPSMASSPAEGSGSGNDGSGTVGKNSAGEAPKNVSPAALEKCFREIMKKHPNDPPSEKEMLQKLEQCLKAWPKRQSVRDLWKSIAPQWKKPKGRQRKNNKSP